LLDARFVVLVGCRQYGDDRAGIYQIWSHSRATKSIKMPAIRTEVPAGPLHGSDQPRLFGMFICSECIVFGGQLPLHGCSNQVELPCSPATSGRPQPLAQFRGEPHSDAIVLHLSDILSDLSDICRPHPAGVETTLDTAPTSAYATGYTTAMRTAILLFLAIGSTAAQEAMADERVDKVFAKWDSTVSPGCALSVIKDGQIVYKRGYGMADLDHDIPINPETVFLESGVKATSSGLERLQALDLAEYVVDEVA